jgi:hypothetical protein
MQWTFEAENMTRGRPAGGLRAVLDNVLFITGTSNWAWGY